MGALGFPAAAAEGDDAWNDSQRQQQQARNPGAARSLVLDFASLGKTPKGINKNQTYFKT